MKPILLLLLALTLNLRAELEFDAIKKELKAGPGARQISCDFTFENKGSKPVNISRYESTCSCMSVQINQGGKLHYAPGEKGVIRANFNMENFSGEVDKNVLLWLEGDSDAKPSITLVVHVIIPVLVDIQPKTLEWKGAGPWEAKTMKIVMNHSEPIRIIDTRLGNPCFEKELKTIVEGKEYELIVTPLMKPDTPPGVAVIHIETDCKIDKQKKQMAFAVVRLDSDQTQKAPLRGKPSTVTPR